MADHEFLQSSAVVAAEVLSALQIPGGGIAQKALEAYVERKRAEAREILFNEIADGIHGKLEFLPEDADPMIEIVYRFWKASEEGAARTNLEFLAQVIAGLKKNRAFVGDRFRKWCAVLEQLNRDELLLIGFAYLAKINGKQAEDEDGNHFWRDTKQLMIEAGYEDRMIGAIAASVSRTGLLLPVSAFGGLNYVDSPLLEELGQLVDMEKMRRV